jgi:hypothetical protein
MAYSVWLRFLYYHTREQDHVLAEQHLVLPFAPFPRLVLFWQLPDRTPAFWYELTVKEVGWDIKGNTFYVDCGILTTECPHDGEYALHHDGTLCEGPDHEDCDFDEIEWFWNRSCLSQLLRDTGWTVRA